MAYIVICATRLADGQLIIIGIVTTLRPSWGQTAGRIVKRVGGTILGCLFASVLLVFAANLSPYALMAVVAVLSGLGQPLRQINYGFWPVFSAPVTLLLTDTSASIGWTDALSRSSYNAAGALVAALATLLIWPSHEEDRIPDRLASLIDAHARLLERAAFLVSPPRPAGQRLGTRAAAEAAARELAAARRRFSQQPHAQTALLTSLKAVEATAAGLRAAVSAQVATACPSDLALSGQLGRLAETLRGAGNSLEEELPDATAPEAAGGGAVADAVNRLVAQAAGSAEVALSMRERRSRTLGRQHE